MCSGSGTAAQWGIDSQARNDLTTLPHIVAAQPFPKDFYAELGRPMDQIGFSAGARVFERREVIQ
jgi:hypothetical protein